MVVVLDMYSSLNYSLWCGGGEMRVFKTRAAARFCKSEGITDRQLADAIERAERGLIDADLGGGLIKQRIARRGKGKSGGWRTLIAYRKAQRAVFLSGFAKNDMDNISPNLTAALKDAASDLLSLSTTEIAARIAEQLLTEVPYGKEN